jgi:hypothetical protein
VVSVDLPSDPRVDQRCRLRRAAPTEQALNRVGEDDGGTEVVSEPEMLSGVESTQSYVCRGLKVSDLEQRVTLSPGDPDN